MFLWDGNLNFIFTFTLALSRIFLQQVRGVSINSCCNTLSVLGLHFLPSEQGVCAFLVSFATLGGDLQCLRLLSLIL